jgi:hypothetical protein
VSELPARQSEFSYTELADCVAREINKRRYVYRNQVATHRMSQQTADREIAMMIQLGEILKKLMLRSERLL